MSIYNSALAYEEVKDPEESLVDLLPMRHLSISNVSSDLQLVNQVVKVSGTVTVSF